MVNLQDACKAGPKADSNGADPSRGPWLLSRPHGRCASIGHDTSSHSTAPNLAFPHPDALAQDAVKIPHQPRCQATATALIMPPNERGPSEGAWAGKGISPQNPF